MIQQRYVDFLEEIGILYPDENLDHYILLSKNKTNKEFYLDGEPSGFYYMRGSKFYQNTAIFNVKNSYEFIVAEKLGKILARRFYKTGNRFAFVNFGTRYKSFYHHKSESGFISRFKRGFCEEFEKLTGVYLGEIGRWGDKTGLFLRVQCGCAAIALFDGELSKRELLPVVRDLFENFFNSTAELIPDSSSSIGLLA